MKNRKIKKLTYTQTMLLLKKLQCHDNYGMTVEPQYLRYAEHAFMIHYNVKVEFTLDPPKKRKRKQN